MPTDDAGWNDYIELPELPEVPQVPESGGTADPDAPRPVGTVRAAPTQARASAGGPGAPEAGAAPLEPADGSPGRPSRRLLVAAVAAAAVVTIVVVALVLAGGGKGSSPPVGRGVTLGNDEWIRRADAVCAKYHDQIQNAATRGDVDTLTTVGQQELDELRALGMPPRNADVAASMLTFLDQAVNDLRNNDLVAFQGAATSVTAEAAKLGLTACASG